MKIFALILFIVSNFFFAQDEEIYANGVFEFSENKPHKIFSKGTFIRETPDIKGKIVDSLNSNQLIQVLHKTENITQLGERSAHWYEISYSRNNSKYQGFVWGGNLCIGYRHKDGKDFLFGLNPSEKKVFEETGAEYFQNIGSVKVMKDSQLLDESFFNSGSGESLSVGMFEIEENKGLENVQYIINAITSGEACGIPGYDQYLLYTDGKLVSLPRLENIGDADVFYHSENYIFPSDKGGKSKHIIFEMEEMEKDENEKEHIITDKKTYSWNGEKLTKI